MTEEMMRPRPASDCDALTFDAALRSVKAKLEKVKPNYPFYAFYDGIHFKCWPDGKIKPVDLITDDHSNRFSE